jgi:hypothetical protein
VRLMTGAKLVLVKKVISCVDLEDIVSCELYELQCRVGVA